MKTRGMGFAGLTVPMLAGLALAGLSLVGPAAAHHSFAMFDAEKTITLNGTVKQMEWANPHSWLHVVVEDGGNAVEYPLEMQGTGQSIRLGWKPDSVKPGDHVTVQMHPMKTGGHGGQLLTVVLPNGQKLGVTGKAPSPFGE
jgi:hypothetical protein